MTKNRQSSLCILSAAAVAVSVASAFASADQIKRPTVPVEVSLKVGRGLYTAKAAGECIHAPRASIYNIASQQWVARHEDDGRDVQLTLWKPADGSAEMFSLWVNGTSNVTVSTVRGGQLSGSGTLKLQPSGKGGTFTIDARGKAGEPIVGTFKCEAFTAAIAEGGD